MKKRLISALYSLVCVLALSFVLSISATTSADAALTCTKCYTACSQSGYSVSNCACVQNCPTSGCTANQSCPNSSTTLICNKVGSCTYGVLSGTCPSCPNSGCVYPIDCIYANSSKTLACNKTPGCNYGTPVGSCPTTCPASGCQSDATESISEQDAGSCKRTGTRFRECRYSDSTCIYGTLGGAWQNNWNSWTGSCSYNGSGYTGSCGSCVLACTPSACSCSKSGGWPNGSCSGNGCATPFNYAGCSKTCDCSLPENAATVSCAASVNYPNNCSKTITKCNTGFYLQGGQCQTCPSNATCDGTENIVCDAPLTLDNNQCVCPTGTSTTGNGGALGGAGACKCPTSGWKWDIDATACTMCADGDNQCGCPVGEVADGNGGCRIGGCDAGEYQISPAVCVDCPDRAGGATSPQDGEGDITTCYKECPSQPVGWPNTNKDGFGRPSTGNQEYCTITNYPEKTYYSVEGGGYPACEYTVEADAGYHPQNNPGANPWCQLHIFNIEYKLFGNTLSKPTDWTDVQWPTSFDIFSMDITPVILPSGPGITCTGAVFEGWYRASDYTGQSYTQVEKPSQPNCADCVDPVFHARMICESGYHAVNGNPSYPPCNICDPDVMTIEFMAPDKTSGVEPAPITCTYRGGCVLPDKGTLFKYMHTFSQWCTGENGTGDCYLVGENLNVLANGKNGEAMTLYAKWTDTSIECTSGTYFPGTGTICIPCAPGDYCPGAVCDNTGGICGNSSCSAATGGEYPSSATGSDEIADCYKNCQPSNVCTTDGYTGGVQNYGGACQYIINSCATGYYLSTNQCVPCPNGGATAGCNSGGIDQCFQTCTPPAPEHLKTITPNDPYNTYYDTDVPGYPMCQFTITCDAPYNAFNNPGPDPTCALGDHINYVLNGGTGTWTMPEYFNDSQLPIDVKNTRIPTRDKSNFAGWYMTDNFTGGEILSITAPGDYTLYARWECQQGYYAKTPNTCEEVGLGYYSPNGDNARYKCPDGFTTLSSISTQITSCYKDEYAPDLDADCDGGYRRASVLMSTAQPTYCTSNTCIYLIPPVVDATYYDSKTLSELPDITGGAGYYFTGIGVPGSWKTDLCQDVTSGYFSPSHTATRTECPAGYNGSDGNRGANTNCYSNCVQLPSVPHSSDVTPVSSKVYYDGAKYPACTYNVDCVYDNGNDMNQYCPKNNGTVLPTCDYCGVCPDGHVCDPDPRLCPAGYQDGPGVTDVKLCRKNCSDQSVANGIMIPNAPYVNPYAQCSYTLHCGAGYKPNASGTACVICPAGEVCPCDPVIDDTCAGTCDPELWCCPDVNGECDPSCLATGKPCFPDPLMCIDIGTGNMAGYWPMSLTGSDQAADCYRNCPTMPMPDGKGVQRPLFSPVYYDAVCKYPLDCGDDLSADCCSCNGNAPGCKQCNCTDEYITCDKGYILDRCECIPEKCENGQIAGDDRRCKTCPPGAVSNPNPIPNGYKAIPKSYPQIPGYALVWGDLIRSPALPSSIGAANTKCLYCGAGAYPNANRNGCLPCPAGTYKTEDMYTFESCAVCPPNADCSSGEPVCKPGYKREKQSNGSVLCVGIEQCDLGDYGYGTINKETGECILLGCLGDHHVSPDGRSCGKNRAECTTANGSGHMDWNGKSYGACVETACNAGYHVNGGVCAPDIVACTLVNATSAQSVWANGKYGPCTALACEYGYIVSGGICVKNNRACAIENGIGYQEWVGDVDTGTWGPCQVELCNPGYTDYGYDSSEPNKPCGVCKNRYAANGEVAVASYVTECEIASCLYQGDLYALDNNECIIICDAGGINDESGMAQWNPITKRCDITCNPGYMKW